MRKLLVRFVAVMMVLCIAFSATCYKPGIIKADETEDDEDWDDEDWDEADEWDEDEEWEDDEDFYTPDQVMNFCATKISKTSVKFKWDKVEDVDGYEILYKKASASEWEMEDYKPSKTSAIIKGLKPNTKYTFKIRAYYYYGEDDEDYEDDEDWDDEDWDDEDWEDEDYEDDEDWDEEDEDWDDEDWDDEDWEDEEWIDDEDYEFGEFSKMTLKTLTKNGKGNTQAVSDTYEQKAAKSVKVPTLKKVKAKTKSVEIKWKKSNKATGYEVYMSKKQKSGYKLIKKINKAGTVKFTKKGLKTGTKYYFKVRAYVKSKGITSYTSYSKVKSVKVK